MSKSLSFRRQVECMILTLELEVTSLERRIKEADEALEVLNDQSQVYALKYGYRDACEFERVELARILKAAKIAFAESTQLVAS